MRVRCLVPIVAAIALLPAIAAAQGGPSLDVTLNFIRDKLANQGALNYAVNVTDTSKNRSWANHFTDNYTNVAANPSGCDLSYHFREMRDEEEVGDTRNSISFGQITDVQVMSREEDMRQMIAADGHSTWTAQVSPAPYILRVVLKQNSHLDLEFADAVMADRVAKATAHAAELCGGLKAEAF